VFVDDMLLLLLLLLLLGGLFLPCGLFEELLFESLDVEVED